MLFSSPIFIFLFLPVTLLGYSLFPQKFKNYLLLLMSLFFYAWGEPLFVFVLLISIFINYLLARAIDHYERCQVPNRAKYCLIIAILFNLSLLGFYKYTDFLITTLNSVLAIGQISPLPLPSISLPLGISFFTFHAMSYVIDVYRKDTPVQKRLSRVALYFVLFPQLIAGPIIRYKTIAGQLAQRVITIDKFAEGVTRFIIGLGKKVLIANAVARAADQIFALPASELTFSLTWVGIACYTLQIFFDFSGYSDMAIGLGKMFGFDFPENFNYPYISQSIREFWRRWHISLSAWFRDYLYIPLGGNRQGTLHTYINLMMVFFLVGLWHGASWGFVIWGIWHGIFLSLERTAWGKILQNIWRPLRHIYTLLIVMIGWVIFRSPQDSSYALVFLKNMFLLGQSEGACGYHALMYLDNEIIIIGLIAILISTPLAVQCGNKINNILKNSTIEPIYALGKISLYVSILLLSIAALSGATYKPFLYFRF